MDSVSVRENVSALWAEYDSTKNRQVREKLILNYLDLVKYIVGRMPQATIPGVEYDDLLGYGVMGLMDAVERFDLSRGVKFETYAMTRIRGAIIDHLRNMDWVPRSVRQKARRIQEAIGRAEARLDRSATDQDIADELGIDVEALDRWTWEISKGTYLSLDELITVDEAHNTATLIDFISDGASPDPEFVIEVEELKTALAAAIDALPERERMVISMYYYDELTIKEIASVLGVSESRISQLHTRAMMRMRVGVIRAAGR
jgi:RNA polymerase sigma factor for flagellar operon FliA